MQHWGTLSVKLRAIEAEIPFYSEFRHALIVVVLNLAVFRVENLSQLERKKFDALLLQLPVGKGTRQRS